MASDTQPGLSPFPARDVSPNSALAGFEFNDGRSYRVFYQAISGAISAIYSDNYGQRWDGPRVMVPPGFAADGTPLMSVIFTDAAGGPNSRTFFLSPDYEVSMLSVTSSQISYNVLAGGSLQAAQFSKLGAVVAVPQSTPGIRIYYQSEDCKVHEATWSASGDFYHSYTFPPPMAGSALTFINPAPPAGLDIRGYYQHSNGVPMEICQDQNGPWFAGKWNLSRQIEKCSRMSATLIPREPNEFGHIVVYFTHQGQLVESTNDGIWRKPMAVPDFQDAGKSFFATNYRLQGSSQQQTRIFYIGPNGLIHWKRKQDGLWVDGNNPITMGKRPTSC